jgi:hypothetical protein
MMHHYTLKNDEIARPKMPRRFFQMVTQMIESMGAYHDSSLHVEIKTKALGSKKNASETMLHTPLL